MRKLLWPVRIGIVALALVLLPAEASEGVVTRAALCAAEAEPDGKCRVEIGSYCVFEGEAIADMTARKSN